jgi:hypothetical protein
LILLAKERLCLDFSVQNRPNDFKGLQSESKHFMAVIIRRIGSGAGFPTDAMHPRAGAPNQ